LILTDDQVSRFYIVAEPGECSVLVRGEGYKEFVVHSNFDEPCGIVEQEQAKHHSEGSVPGKRSGHHEDAVEDCDEQGCAEEEESHPIVAVREVDGLERVAHDEVVLGESEDDHEPDCKEAYAGIAQGPESRTREGPDCQAADENERADEDLGRIEPGFLKVLLHGAMFSEAIEPDHVIAEMESADDHGPDEELEVDDAAAQDQLDAGVCDEDEDQGDTRKRVTEASNCGEGEGEDQTTANERQKGKQEQAVIEGLGGVDEVAAEVEHPPAIGGLDLEDGGEAVHPEQCSRDAPEGEDAATPKEAEEGELFCAGFYADDFDEEENGGGGGEDESEQAKEVERDAGIEAELLEQAEQEGVGLEVDSRGVVSGVGICIEDMEAAVEVGSAFSVIGGQIVLDKASGNLVVKQWNNDCAGQGKESGEREEDDRPDDPFAVGLDGGRGRGTPRRDFYIRHSILISAHTVCRPGRVPLRRFYNG